MIKHHNWIKKEFNSLDKNMSHKLIILYTISQQVTLDQQIKIPKILHNDHLMKFQRTINIHLQSKHPRNITRNKLVKDKFKRMIMMQNLAKT